MLTTYSTSESADNAGEVDVSMCNDSARRIFAEWLNLQLSRRVFWQHGHGTRPAGSLRNACNLAIEAYRTHNELELFGDGAAAAMVHERLHGKEPETVAASIHKVEDALRSLVARAAALAGPFVVKPGADATRGCRSSAEVSNEKIKRSNLGPLAATPTSVTPARYDDDCQYFTCVDLGPEDIPWEKKDDAADDWEIAGLETASDQWLETVGLLKK